MFRIRVESCRWKLVSLVEFVELVVVVAVYPWEMLDVWRCESRVVMVRWLLEWMDWMNTE
jgi:hypothetical protein